MSKFGVTHRLSTPYHLNRINCHRLKHYYGGDTPPLVIPGPQTSLRTLNSGDIESSCDSWLSTTTHSDDPSPSSSPVKTSDNLEEFADELILLKKDVQQGNFQDHSNPLFEFDDNFKSSTINPLFDEMENSNVFDEPVLLNTPLSDKVEYFALGDNNDEIDAFLAMEVSSNFEEGYFDSEGDITFLDNLLSDDASHNLASEVISDHETEQNDSSRNDPLYHEFAGELLTLPSRNDREFGEYLSLMTVLCEIQLRRYGYIKNHKKTVKNGQTRTRETEEYKRSQRCKAKARKGQTSVNYGSTEVNSLEDKSQMLPT
ncbi:hypothetical protein Tco_0732640 [Tanacetum coccineum]